MASKLRCLIQSSCSSLASANSSTPSPVCNSSMKPHRELGCWSICDSVKDMRKIPDFLAPCGEGMVLFKHCTLCIRCRGMTRDGLFKGFPARPSSYMLNCPLRLQSAEPQYNTTRTRSCSVDQSRIIIKHMPIRTLYIHAFGASKPATLVFTNR